MTGESHCIAAEEGVGFAVPSLEDGELIAGESIRRSRAALLSSRLVELAGFAACDVKLEGFGATSGATLVRLLDFWPVQTQFETDGRAGGCVLGDSTVTDDTAEESPAS